MNFSYNNYDIKPYKARNIIKKQQTAEENGISYVNVNVFTASGALPVSGAIVTVYHTYNGGDEHVLYNLITDENGGVPTMEVPIVYRGPGEQTEYTYSTYNLRVEANGYYTYNLLDFQVFPNITSSYSVNLIPTAQGEPSERPSQTFIIPPRP